MSRISYKHTLLFAFLFFFFGVSAQKKFELDIKESTFFIDEEKFFGYASSFDFNREQIRKGWWKYAKSFGAPTDMRTHYIVQVPVARSDGDANILVYSQLESVDRHFEFRVGSTDAYYKPQLKKLLIEFKIQFYIQYYLNRISDLEKESSALSSDYTGAKNEDTRRSLLMNIQNKKLEIDHLYDRVKHIEKTWR